MRRLAVLVVSAAALGLLPAASAGSSSTAPVIAFVSDQSGDYELWTVRLDGTGLHRLTRAKGMDDTPAWSPRRTAHRVHPLPDVLAQALGDERERQPPTPPDEGLLEGRNAGVVAR